MMKARCLHQNWRSNPVASIDSTLLPFTNEDWQVQQGLASVVLISAGGTQNCDFALAGQMAVTEKLRQNPQLMARLAALQRPLSRTRVLRLPKGGHDLQEHSYHRYNRHLIYIPLLLPPEALFYVDGQAVALQTGQACLVAGRQPQQLVNPTDAECVLLVCETRQVNPETDAPLLEAFQFEMPSPEAMQALFVPILASLAASALEPTLANRLQLQLSAILQDWASVFARFGNDKAGELSYQDVLLDFSALMNGKLPHLTDAAKQAVAVIESVLKTSNQPTRKRHFSRYFFAAQQPLPAPEQCPQFEKPIFIVSAPRAGSTLLFETLAKFPSIWTISEESHELIEDIPELHPSAQNFNSNRLGRELATLPVVEQLKSRFVRQLRDREGRVYTKLAAGAAPKSLRFLEKTPKNALRIPFLKAAFPDALFVYLYREPEGNISSLLEGWRSLRFVAYRNLPDWVHRQWSFFLPEGWRDLHSAPLVDIAAHQWRFCNDTIIADLMAIPRQDWCRISYSDLVQDPQATLAQVAHFAELDKDRGIQDLLANALPVSKLTLSQPGSNKWHKYAEEISSVLAVDIGVPQ
ncbi:MAG: sulfotransferase [Methylococcales bacterium]|nr:sulfotransferase [Methylococcales bacterium]